VDERRVSNRDLKCDAGSVTEAKKVCPIDFQKPKQRRDVVCGRLKPDGSISVAGTAMALFFQGNDPAILREERKNSPKRALDGGSAAMQQDQWHSAAGSVHFVVHADPVDGRMTALDRLGGKPCRASAAG
jgi:hypothetical protein